MLKRWAIGAALAGMMAATSAGTAAAAPIGTFSLVDDDPFGVLIDVANLSSTLVFTNLSVSFCDGSVVPADAPPSFLLGDGSVRTCNGRLVNLAGFGEEPVEAGLGLQFTAEFPSRDVEGNSFVPRFAFLNMSVRSPRDGSAIPFGVDPLDLTCVPSQQDCTNFIYRLDGVPVPEPATLALLAAGVLSLAAHRRAARRFRQPDSIV